MSEDSSLRRYLYQQDIMMNTTRNMSLVQLATNESGDANVVVEMESEAVYKLTDKHTTVQ